MSPTPTWVADTEPNPTRSLYTRGNAGEVFPNVITVLTGTLIGDEPGILAVMRIDAITSVADGTMLHVDGEQGTVSIL